MVFLTALDTFQPSAEANCVTRAHKNVTNIAILNLRDKEYSLHYTLEIANWITRGLFAIAIAISIHNI
jgi:hypothetical protein